MKSGSMLVEKKSGCGKDQIGIKDKRLMFIFQTEPDRAETGS